MERVLQAFVKQKKAAVHLRPLLSLQNLRWPPFSPALKKKVAVNVRQQNKLEKFLLLLLLH